jgi:hypothetical protein
MSFDPQQPRDEIGRWTDGVSNDTKKKIQNKVAGDVKNDISASVRAYQSTLFENINNELRYDNTGRYSQIVDNLDKVATDTTSDTLYRGLASDFTSELANKFKIKNINDLEEVRAKLVGQEIHDKAFISATTDLNTAAYFMRDKGTGKPAILQIEGQKTGIKVGKHSTGFTTKNEKEFLIKRGTRLKITDVRLSKTGKLILNVST